MKDADALVVTGKNGIAIVRSTTEDGASSHPTVHRPGYRFQLLGLRIGPNSILAEFADSAVHGAPVPPVDMHQSMFTEEEMTNIVHPFTDLLERKAEPSFEAWEKTPEAVYHRINTVMLAKRQIAELAKQHEEAVGMVQHAQGVHQVLDANIQTLKIVKESAEVEHAEWQARVRHAKDTHAALRAEHDELKDKIAAARAEAEKPAREAETISSSEVGDVAGVLAVGTPGNGLDPEPGEGTPLKTEQ